MTATGDPGPLLGRISELVARHSPVPFSTVVDVALYDDAHGFYGAARGHAGRRGALATHCSGHAFGVRIVKWEPVLAMIVLSAIGIGASDGLMTRADAPHVVQLHSGAFDEQAVNRWAHERSDVAHHQTMLLLGILHRLGTFQMRDEEVARALQELDSYGRDQQPDIPFSSNSARSLALQLNNSIPVILADASLGGAAVRWQNQCNENGKRWAFAGVIPEALHNIVEAMRRAPLGGESPFHVILLEDLSRSRASRVRLDAIQDVLSEGAIPWTRLPFAGESALSILLQACVMGDWVSYYLAVDNGLDPSPVPMKSVEKRSKSACVP